jgi:acetolactate synthase-1/2/3 large subunit
MLATGIPSALGAKLAAPEREVVCVTGDGAAGFSFMELQSAAREGLQLVAVVFAEGSWSVEVSSQVMSHGAPSAPRWGTCAGS